MELLMALGGLAALAVLLQSKALPSEDDFKKAVDKLDKNPKDPDASTIAGKYTAFVLGDYVAGLPFLANSTDETLRTLAAHELDPDYTNSAPKKIGMGDDWVLGARKHQALFRIFYDRAAQWYGLAWPDLDPVWKDKARAQGIKLSQARPPGGSKKGIPAGWDADMSGSGRAPALDGMLARTGSYSMRIPPADEKVPGSWSSIKSAVIPVSGKAFEVSAYVFSNGTDNTQDSVYLFLRDKKGVMIQILPLTIPLDQPFWTRISTNGNLPGGAASVQVGATLYSKKSPLWIDDFSLKIDGKEVLKNASFEA